MTPSRLWSFWPPLGINLLALGVGLVRWRRLDRPGRVLVAYLTLCAATTIAIEILVRAGGAYRPIVHLFTPLQVGAFAWMYSGWGRPKLGKAYLWAAAAYATACLVLMPLENLDRFRGPSFFLGTSIMLGMSLTLLIDLAFRTDRFITERPGFWVAAGVLPDQAISLVLYAGREWILANAPGWRPWVFLLRALLVTVGYACFALALTFPGDATDEGGNTKPR